MEDEVKDSHPRGLESSYQLEFTRQAGGLSGLIQEQTDSHGPLEGKSHTSVVAHMIACRRAPLKGSRVEGDTDASASLNGQNGLIE